MAFFPKDCSMAVINMLLLIRISQVIQLRFFTGKQESYNFYTFLIFDRFDDFWTVQGRASPRGVSVCRSGCKDCLIPPEPHV